MQNVIRCDRPIAIQHFIILLISSHLILFSFKFSSHRIFFSFHSKFCLLINNIIDFSILDYLQLIFDLNQILLGRRGVFRGRGGPATIFSFFLSARGPTFLSSVISFIGGGGVVDNEVGFPLKDSLDQFKLIRIDQEIFKSPHH